MTAPVKNTGSVAGREVLQVYVTPSSSTKLTHPLRTLRGYAKTKELAPGESVEVVVSLDKYALSYWCTVENRWKIEKGIYGIVAGACAEDTQLAAQVEVAQTTYWDGL